MYVCMYVSSFEDRHEIVEVLIVAVDCEFTFGAKGISWRLCCPYLRVLACRTGRTKLTFDNFLHSLPQSPFYGIKFRASLIKSLTRYSAKLLIKSTCLYLNPWLFFAQMIRGRFLAQFRPDGSFDATPN